jgi:hypothetical protein
MGVGIFLLVALLIASKILGFWTSYGSSIQQIGE